MSGETLLARQLKRCGLSAEKMPQNLQEWKQLIDVVAKTYQEDEEDRHMLERSQELASREMEELFTAHAEAKEREIQLGKQLITAARVAGMSEVATSVLHNVGNVLNSVNVSVQVLKDKIQQSKLTNLKKIKEMLEKNAEHLGDYIVADPQGKHLPEYLIQLADYWGTEQVKLTAEVESLAKNIDLIKTIIAVQQSSSGVSGLIEAIAITDLIEDSLLIYAERLKQENIEIIRDYQFNSTIMADKAKLQQIIINLIQNAKDSLVQSNQSKKQLALCTKQTNENSAQVLVNDNGIGIAPENLKKIFIYGFTTKKTGHGFGLHSGANAAREMGGSLTAISAGLDQGATFILQLPCQIATDAIKKTTPHEATS